MTDQGNGERETAAQILELIDTLIESEPVRRGTSGRTRGVFQVDDEYLRDLRARASALLVQRDRQESELRALRLYRERVEGLPEGTLVASPAGEETQTRDVLPPPDPKMVQIVNRGLGPFLPPAGEDEET